MKLKLNMLAAAAAMAFAAGGAQAAVGLPGASTFGNSSLLFIAVDTNDSVAFAADLGLNMSDMLTGSSRYAAGTTTTWNFNTDTSTDASVTGNSWSPAFANFLATATGNDYKWAVIAGDSVQGSGSTVTASNAIAGRGMLATGNASAQQMLAASTSTPTGTALTTINNFYSAAANLGNLISANNGAGTTTSIGAFTTLGDNFNGSLTWSYMSGDGASSNFQYQRQIVANPVVFQIGVKTPSTDFTSTDSLSDVPVTFTFDAASGNLVLAAVPEPGTYAMMLAGLAAIGAFVRRRKA